ncbi:cystatin-1-like [Pituophis catenifer annectens]|uniref:cystatin-1-like n=1 Tax=Pituophis catenifer annectens TaxID=94852 RepID=UPI003991861F
MERSRLPLPSLLCLFGVLLMLSPELLLGIAGNLSDVPVTDPGVQEALAFAVEQYNQERRECVNYFKQLRLLKALSQVETRDEYHLKVEMVKTRCGKKACCKLSYKRIQMCELVRGNPEKRNCYFIVRPRSPPNEMTLETIACV